MPQHYAESNNQPKMQIILALAVSTEHMIWHTMTNIAVAVTLIWPYLFVPDKITNVDNFIECTSNIFIMATLRQKCSRNWNNTFWRTVTNAAVAVTFYESICVHIYADQNSFTYVASYY